MSKFNPDTEHFVHYQHDPDIPNSLSNDVVTALYEDQNGNFWIGTENGLNKFYRDLDDPDAVFLVEEWESREKLDHHFNSEQYLQQFKTPDIKLYANIESPFHDQHAISQPCASSAARISSTPTSIAGSRLFAGMRKACRWVQTCTTP